MYMYIQCRVLDIQTSESFRTRLKTAANEGLVAASISTRASCCRARQAFKDCIAERCLCRDIQRWPDYPGEQRHKSGRNGAAFPQPSALHPPSEDVGA